MAWRGRDYNRRRPAYGCRYAQEDKTDRREFSLSLQKLEAFSKMDSEELILIVSTENSGWKTLLLTELSETGNKFVLIIRIVKKICESAFPQFKSKILLQICDTGFVEQLCGYLSKLLLHDERDKRNNNNFWNNNNQFLNELIIVFDNILQLMPKTAGEILPKLLTQTGITVSQIERLHPDIVVAESVKDKLDELQTKLALCMEKAVRKKKTQTEDQALQSDDAIEEDLVEPPDNFRQVSLCPTLEELANEEPVFIRSNIVKGRYKSVDHYLDVHFRLLREDFVKPLRNAICEYRLQNEAPQQHGTHKHNFNVRFYHNVEVRHLKLQQDKVTYVIQVSNKKKKESLMDYSKRLIFGSLLCFTNDNFRSITFATITNQDKTLLTQGQIAVEFFTDNLELNKKYTMVECAVYFEPYYQVLRGLQSLTEDTFPLKQYIIDVQTDVQPPAYYNEESEIDYSEHTFNPLIPTTWPSANQLKMDESQLRAFQAAVTREFCVIQGPPGTGKTYIGLKVAELLLDNHETWNENRHPILIISYTNHALDQFLEGILNFTKDIVRIGGQSKNKKLEIYNIREQRKMQRRSGNVSDYYRLQKDALESSLSKIKRDQKIIDMAQRFDLIFSFRIFLQSNPELQDTWFEEALNVQQRKWLMGGRIKQQRIAEPQDLRLKRLLTYVKIAENPEALNDNEDFDEKFSSCILESNIILTQNCLLDRIESLQNEFLKRHNSEVPVLSAVKEAILEELETVIEECEYLQFRMDEQKKIMETVELPNVLFSKLHEISADQRWQLYAFWLRNYLTDLQNSLDNNIKDYQKKYKEFDEVKQMQDVDLMRDRKVIGMTTTGAARFQILLKALKCPIVIVEEAAEVLESHVVVALTNECKHLILIGDHQQLRPSTVEYSLVKEHSLDISLFERMVKNNIHCECLEVQHRMRPEISRLIVPAIYPSLQDHEDVQHYPNVLGVTQNIFFITHTEFEAEMEQMSSKINVHEANFIIRLARYLLLQGYDPEDITILTPYSGQKMLLLTERKNFPLLADLRITDVDDYQGEENKIVLLTLVRSNINAKIGFLGINNRVNVALSRAKEGLFIIGNMENFVQAHNVWPKIKRVLVEHNQIGTHLTLRCQIHKDKETKVKCADDFQQVPEGGCNNVCNAFLTCGHYCASICHVIDREHANYLCQETCNKVLCELNHLCPDLCSEKCKPCKVQVFAHLPCGHEAHKPCAETDYKCLVLVQATLNCGHPAEKSCFVNICDVPCSHPCEIRRPCGHTCEEYCHIFDDPDHQIKRCYKECTRLNVDCSLGIHKCEKSCSDDCALCTVSIKKRRACDHVYKVPCSYNVEELNCTKPCKKKLPCNHPCKSQCNEPCDPCKVVVVKSVDGCGHKVRIECHLEADKSVCKEVCPRLLPCGHPCGKSCRDPCTEKCTVLVDNTHPVACGHTFQIPCYLREQNVNPYSQKLLKYCTQPCDLILKCTHRCSGTCGQCVQGRIHAPCKEKCGRAQICNHVCEIPCSETCPPCNKPCSYRCTHSKCGKTCGEPCTPCAEKCSRRCAHVKCSKLCGEKCDVDACREPCSKRLKCKHPCLGFCGDPCPAVCRVCSPNHKTFDVYFGDEDEPDARFVHLQDCKHNIESKAMDRWMLMSDDQEAKGREVQLKKCPKCTTVITKTQRYAHIIKDAFTDVMKVKRHWFGEEQQNNVERIALINRVENQFVLNKSRLFKQHNSLTITLMNINKKLGNKYTKQRNPVHKILINACKAKTQLCEEILKICELRGKHDLERETLKLLKLLFTKIDQEDSMSNQFICDIQKEINRFERALQLLCVENAPSFNTVDANQDSKDLYDRLVHVIFASSDIYSDEIDQEVKSKIQELKDLVDKSMVVTERERTMIVAAIGLGKGRWFACPNGHLYCIGECGGAMEIGRCNECDAEIGGRSHTLLPTNRFAGEMDGATCPAWSNNPTMDLRNFQILD